MQTKLFVDKNGKPKERAVKSVNFFPHEEALLLWCLTKHEDFTNFVKRILKEAKETEEKETTANPPLNRNDIRQIITDVVRTELTGRLIIAEAETTAPNLEEEAAATDINPNFYDNIDNLF